MWPGKGAEAERVSLPFQTIERVNDVRRSREGQPPLGRAADIPASWPGDWRNKLIWGDNKYVLPSLLDEFAGKVDLIYIDPPFATGADFRYNVSVGDTSVEKMPTSLEEVAYRDTWAGGINSFIPWMAAILNNLTQLLASNGSLYIHCDANASHYLKALADDLLGSGVFQNEIVWASSYGGKNMVRNRYGRGHDTILYYARAQAAFKIPRLPLSDATLNNWYQYRDQDGRRYNVDNLLAPGPAAGYEYEFLGVTRRWRYPETRMNELLHEGRIVHQTTTPGSKRRVAGFKRYLDESEGGLATDLWTDINPLNRNARELRGYPTQKPEALVERVVEASSNPGDLVLDCFAGSGTTAAVAEKLGRRWIAADIGRFAIQTTRKRLLDIAECRPFEVLNLGRYERRYWAGAETGEAVGEYYRFILELYGARPVEGFAHLHGERDGRMVHVGATDAPVTRDELERTLEECAAAGAASLDALGWEWEMGLNPAGRDELAREHGVAVRLFHIPREVMDRRAVDAGDVHFFELSVAEAGARVSGLAVEVELTGFLPAIDDYMREKAGGKASKWSDWIDYWSVDFEYDGETFVNRWQAYRTRREPRLALRSDPHEYAEPGTRRVVVKVIDIFGNDTTHELTVAAGRREASA